MSEVQQNFDSFVQTVTRGNEPKNDMMMMNEFHDLNTSTIVAPICIAILGELTLLANNRELSLVDSKSDISSFKYLKYPNSFCASLCQISYMGYRAFLEADRAMDCIRLSTNQIPNLMKQSMKILFNGTPDDLIRYLPISLHQIKINAENCSNEVKNVLEKFDVVINALHELEISSVSTQGNVKNAKEQVKIESQQEIKEIEYLEAVKLKINEDSKKTEQYLEEANKAFYKALDEMPSAGKIIGMTLMDTVCNFISAIPATLVTTVSKVLKTEKKEKPSTSLSVDDTIIMHKALELEKYLDSMFSFFIQTPDAIVLNKEVIKGVDMQNDGFNGLNAEYILKTFSNFLQQMKGGSLELINKLKIYCEKTQSVLVSCIHECDKIVPENVDIIYKSLKDIHNEILFFNSEQCVKFNVSPFQKKGPFATEGEKKKKDFIE